MSTFLPVVDPSQSIGQLAASQHTGETSNWLGRRVELTVEIPILSLFKGAIAQNPATETNRPDETEVFASKYGSVSLQPFNPTWLEDVPGVIEHLDSEHNLHVKGKDKEGVGLTWHTEKFKTDMDIRFEPEAKLEGSQRGGFQMKIGYFEIPKENLDTVEAISFSLDVQENITIKDTQNKIIAYRFFVHPSAYKHYRNLHNKFKFITPDKSEFMGTPTSSYRSWAVRHVREEEGVFRPASKSPPFIVKMGVEGDILGSDRWLSYNEIDRSVKAQVAFDSFKDSTFKAKDGAKLYIFPESFGMKLKEISDYPATSVEKKSGVIIREFPKEILGGKCRILSLAALISPERIKPENREQTPAGSLPLIYEVIEATIKAGKAKDTQDFIDKYLNKMYLDIVEKVVFREGMTIEPHSQNLSIVLNPDLTPKGFAYRDHGGIWVDIATRGLLDKDIEHFYREEGDDHKIFKAQGAIAKNYIGSYSWFYRYQVFIKTLNIITQLPDDILSDNTPPPPGAPFQIGTEAKLEERNLHRYCIKQLEAEGKIHETAIGIIKKLSLTQKQSLECLTKLDSSYHQKMDQYFDLSKVDIKMEGNAFPSAEGGSSNEGHMYNHKGFLGKQRFRTIDSSNLRLALSEVPEHVMEKIKNRIITSFENQNLNDLNPTNCLLANKGLCFLNGQNEIVAFAPFIAHGEKEWIEKQLDQND